MKELKLEAKSDNLQQLFDFILTELVNLGCVYKEIRQVKLCVEEIYMNIANYAYSPNTGEAKITIETGDESEERIVVKISFSDSGKPFNPLEIKKPNLDADLDERTIGGLGIFIVREKMDDVSYEYKDNHNILTIQKKLTRIPDPVF